MQYSRHERSCLSVGAQAGTADVLMGGEADETSLGLGGNDGIAGREGADLIEGGELACDFNCVAYDSAANASAFSIRTTARIAA